ncbi:MAG: flagellar basal body rod protein FlgC [Rhodobacteraceae bacterium]|nr:flagellar basal body rod protein FlgC [Paracoccaceae bacterium]
MSDILATLAVAAGGMRAQDQRLRHVAENIANADTPGYRRKLVDFAPAAAGEGAVRLSPVRLDPRPLPAVYAPGHPLADATGHYAGSNVELVVEIADAREAQRSYEANLAVFDQARQMAGALIDLLRR